MDIQSHYIGATAFGDVLKNEDVDVQVLASLAQVNKEWLHVAGTALDHRKDMHIVRRWLPFVDNCASMHDTHIIVPAFAQALQTLGACMKRKKGQRRPNLEAVLSAKVFHVVEVQGDEEQTQLVCLNTLDLLLSSYAAFKKPECLADQVCVEMVLMHITLRYILEIVTTVYPSLAYNSEFLTAFLDHVREVRENLRRNIKLLPPVILRSMLGVIHDAHVLFSRHAMFETHLMAIVAAFQ
jgi:hypothetical protein